VDGAGNTLALNVVARPSAVAFERSALESPAMHPYLTLAEAADLARISPKRLSALMAAGVLVEGQHFTRPRGLRPRFKRAAILAWLDASERETTVGAAPRRGRGRPRCKLDKSLL